jgi:hypothetical protein
LSFIKNKEGVYTIIRNIVRGLKKGGVAYISLYGKKSHFYSKHRHMSFYSYQEIVGFLERLSITIFQRLTKEGYGKSDDGRMLYHHSHRFLLQKK